MCVLTIFFRGITWKKLTTFSRPLTRLSTPSAADHTTPRSTVHPQPGPANRSRNALLASRMLRRLARMTHDTHASSDDRTSFAHVDPWAVLQDGRRQLLAALDACDPRSGARTLAIPEFANLGETTGTLSALLLAHAARDRTHAAFFTSLGASEGGPRSITVAVDIPEDIAGDWPAIRAEVEAARLAMLEATAGLASERWEQRLLPPRAGAAEESLPSLLVVRAMCDGILADAIAALTTEAPER